MIILSNPSFMHTFRVTLSFANGHAKFCNWHSWYYKMLLWSTAHLSLNTHKDFMLLVKERNETSKSCYIASSSIELLHFRYFAIMDIMLIDLNLEIELTWPSRNRPRNV